jgi:hypothetical protein
MQTDQEKGNISKTTENKNKKKSLTNIDLKVALKVFQP